MTSRLTDPREIDAGFVPRLRGEVVTVRVEDESVLYEEDTGRLHQLDAIATVVCGCFDGEASLAKIGEELAAAFTADPRVVTDDVLRMATRLGRLGLLAGVRGQEAIEEDDGGC